MGFLTSLAALTPGQGTPRGSQVDFIRLSLLNPSSCTSVQLEVLLAVGLFEPQGSMSSFYKVVCTASPRMSDHSPAFVQGRYHSASRPSFMTSPGLGLPALGLHCGLFPTSSSVPRMQDTLLPSTCYAQLASHFFAVDFETFEECLRHTSVALGCAPSTFNPRVTEQQGFEHFATCLLSFCSFLLPLFLSLMGLLGLSVLQCLMHKVDRKSPLGFLLRLPTLGISTTSAYALGCAGTTRPILSWEPWKDRKGRVNGAQPRRKSARQPTPAIIRVLHCVGIYAGMLQAPQVVWAAPPGLVEAVRQLEQAIVCLPEPSPHSAPPLLPADTSGQPDVSDADFPDSPPHDAIEADNKADAQALVLIAGHKSAHVKVKLRHDSTAEEVVSAIQNSWRTQPYTGRVVLTLPPISDDYISALLVPCWTQATLRVVIVLDFTLWGGPLYAEFAWCQVTYGDLAAAARNFLEVPWDVFHFRKQGPIQSGDRINVASGDVFKFMPIGRRPAWAISLQDALGTQSFWDPTVACLYTEPPSTKCLALTDNGTWLFPAEHATDSMLQFYIATARHTKPELLSYGTPQDSSPLLPYVKHGCAITRVIAAHTRPPDELS